MMKKSSCGGWSSKKNDIWSTGNNLKKPKTLKVRKGSGLKSDTSGSTVMVLLGRPFTFLHRFETNQQIHDTQSNSSRCHLVSNKIFSLGSHMGGDGLRVLVNLLKAEIECICNCGETNVSTRIELVNLAHAICIQPPSSRNPIIGESVLAYWLRQPTGKDCNGLSYPCASMKSKMEDLMLLWSKMMQTVAQGTFTRRIAYHCGSPKRSRFWIFTERSLPSAWQKTLQDRFQGERCLELVFSM